MKDRLIKLVEEIQPENKKNTLDSIEMLLLECKENKEEPKAALMLAIIKNYYESYPEVIGLLEKFAGKVSRSRLNLYLHDSVNNYVDNYYNDNSTKVKGLIRAGADTNSRDYKGKSPLHKAVLNCTVTIVKILCDASPSKKTLTGIEDLKDSIIIDFNECDNENILSYFIQNRFKYGRYTAQSEECKIIKFLVNAGAYIQLWAIIALKNEIAKDSLNRKKPNETLEEITNFLEKKRKEREQEIQKIKEYIKNKKTPDEEPENKLELFSSELEEKITPEDIFDDFQLQSSNFEHMKSDTKVLLELVYLSFLNQKPSQKLITELKENIGKNEYHFNFIETFEDMIKFIKYYDEKSSAAPIVIRAILNLISHIQDTNLMNFFIINLKKSNQKGIPLSYSSEYPIIQKALLKFAPYEQCRLLEKINSNSFNKLGIDKSRPTADLYDLLFYLEQRADDGSAYKARVKILTNLIKSLRIESNWQDDRLLKHIKKCSEDLNNFSSATLKFFGQPQNVMEILKGISNRFQTIEAFKEHAQGFLNHIDRVKYKILTDNIITNQNNAPISNNNISNNI